MSKNILITGTSGFIGRHLAEYFNNWRCYNIFVPKRYDLNLLESESVRQYIIEKEIDIVIHCATVNPLRSPNEIEDLTERNLRMFFNFEKCSNCYDKMIYFGSGAEYDMNHYIPLMQESYFGTYIPDDAYGFSKYVMSRVVELSKNIYDLRLFGVYGKYEEWNRRFISNNICKSLKGLPMTINKNMNFDYLYIDDLCKILEWFIEHTPKYHHYNVCTSQVIDLFSLAKMINEVSGIEREIIIREEGMKTEYSGDNSRLITECGNFQFADKKETIQTLWEYYKEHIDEIDIEQLK